MSVISAISTISGLSRRWLLLLPLLLQGCVVSQIPIFDEKDAIIEPSFTGHYTFKGLEKVPANWEVFLKDNKYVMVADPKQVFVATLHPWHDSTYLVQFRQIGTPKTYSYFLARKSDTGFELNFIPCEASCITMNDLHSFTNLAGSAFDSFHEKEFATAERTAELGH